MYVDCFDGPMWVLLQDLCPSVLMSCCVDLVYTWVWSKYCLLCALAQCGLLQDDDVDYCMCMQVMVILLLSMFGWVFLKMWRWLCVCVCVSNANTATRYFWMSVPQSVLMTVCVPACSGCRPVLSTWRGNRGCTPEDKGKSNPWPHRTTPAHGTLEDGIWGTAEKGEWVSEWMNECHTVKEFKYVILYVINI